MIRLLLVDDHAVVREGYRRLLERRVDLHIEAEAGTAAEAYGLFQKVRPDVVVVDINLPDMGGIELIRRLLNWDRQAHILAFSMHRDPLYAAQALRAGALGYVTKGSRPEVLVQAVYQVHEGQKVLSPDVAPELAWALMEDRTPLAQELTPREFEILRQIVAGRSPEEVGASLHISPKTVQNTHYAIKSKLGLRSDIELMRWAARMNLLD